MNRLVCILAGVLAVGNASAENSFAGTDAPCCAGVDEKPSWIFRPSTYTHDPFTGARVAQYMRTPPVEPLDDERMVTSRYRRSRTNLRGVDGSVDSYYEVQAWGNGRGGIDAEWERFHNAWKESYLQGGYYNQGPAYGPWNGWGGYGWPSGGFRGHWPPQHGGHHGGPWSGQGTSKGHFGPHGPSVPWSDGGGYDD